MGNDGITIRRATASDINGIVKLLGQVLSVHHSGRPDIFKEIGQKYSDDELLSIIRNDDNPVFVCVDDNSNVLGHCFCQTVNRKETLVAYSYKTLYIDDLCVDESSRGKHLGKMLYEHARRYASDNGYYNITLHAWACNPNAVAFYRHLGMSVQQYTMEDVLTQVP